MVPDIRKLIALCIPSQNSPHSDSDTTITKVDICATRCYNGDTREPGPGPLSHGDAHGSKPGPLRINVNYLLSFSSYFI